MGAVPFLTAAYGILISQSINVHSFHWTPQQIYPSPSSARLHTNKRCPPLLAAGGFGSTKNTKPKKMNPSQAKRATASLLQRYGGDIQKGTQSRIDEALASLPPHLQEAASLYKQVTQFESLVSTMTVGDAKRLIPHDQWEISKSDRNRLNELMEEHSLSERDLHNIYQRITWDASADAKATRADIAGNKMKGDLQERIDKACSIAVEAVTKSNGSGKLLDVGCGHGSIVPSLNDLPLDSYVGIDLSEEMVKNAIERYGGERDKLGRSRVFVAGDFLTHDFSGYAEDKMVTGGENACGVFDAVMFCSSLHDLPDMENCIGRAASLLVPGGKMVIVHAQGAMHVLGQHQSNPVMVQRGLPTTKEWVEMIDRHVDDWKLTLEYEPADPRSDRDEKEGYLAVLTKE